MTFFIFLIFSIWLFSSLKDEKSFSIAYIFFAVVWILMVGGQNNVGTDYENYRNIFSHPNYYELFQERHEYLFFFIISLSKRIFDDPVVTFMLIAGISVLCLYKITQLSLPVEQRWIYVFLLIAFSTSFNNQFNAIRQYLSTFIFMVGFLYVMNKKWYIGGGVILLARGIHSSITPLYLIIFIFYIISFYRIKRSLLLALLIISAVIPLLDNAYDHLSDYMLLGGNIHYLEHSYVRPLIWEEKILKYFYLLFFLFAIIKMPKMDLTLKEYRLFVVGVFAFSLRMITLISSVSNRFGMFLELMMIFPLVFYFSYLQKKHPICFFIVFFIFMGIYFIKVTFLASGEYLYKSIFF